MSLGCAPVLNIRAPAHLGATPHFNGPFHRHAPLDHLHGFDDPHPLAPPQALPVIVRYRAILPDAQLLVFSCRCCRD
jgi:hypothetical protein